jgi:signal recognition particle subunit SRP68
MLCVPYHYFYSCRTIYEKLGGAIPEEQRALYSQRVEEMVPSIRYCAYNIGDMPSDLSQLMKLRTSAPGSDILSSKIDVSGGRCNV